MPEFDLEVSAQDENPYKTMEYNQLALQLFQMGFFREDMADQALRCLELMDFKNKDQLKGSYIRDLIFPERIGIVVKCGYAVFSSFPGMSIAPMQL